MKLTLQHTNWPVKILLQKLFYK